MSKTKCTPFKALPVKWATFYKYKNAGNKSNFNQWTEIGGTSVRFSAPSPNGLKRLFHHSEVVAHAYIVPSVSRKPVISMNQELEKIIKGKGLLKFKSEGERRIASFLEDSSVKYQYEPGVLVNSYEYKPRIWYPDFYLPEFGTYIEYYGLAGRQNYDRGIKRKEVVYSKMGLDVIPVYPWTFTENWQSYIMEELEQTAIRRYRTLMAKPYWSQSRSPSYHHVSPTRNGYHHGLRKRY